MNILIKASTVSEYNSESLVVLYEVNPSRLQTLATETEALRKRLGVDAIEIGEGMEWYDLFQVANEDEQETLENHPFVVLADERAEEISQNVCLRITGDTMKMHPDGDFWFEGWEKHSDLRVNTSILNVRDFT